MTSSGSGKGRAPTGDAPGDDLAAWLDAVDGRAAGVTGPGRRWARNRVLLSGPGSTNALARRVVDELLAEEVPLPRVAFVAWEQTAGRGRQGRSWHSPAGAGAWVSLVRPLSDPDDAGLLPLLVPLGLCEALDRHLPEGRPCRIKWPNDLLVEGRKIGGVLIEGVAPRTGDRGPGAAVIGFGINLLQSERELETVGRKSGAALDATSLVVERREPVTAAEVLWELVEGVAQRIADPDDAGAVVASYRERSVHRPGEPLRCRGGDETVEGLFRGFDDHGFLRLELTGPAAGRGTGDEVLMRAGEVVG